MPKTYGSELCALIHEDAKEFYEDGIIDEAAMHEFDVDCLIPTPTLSPQEIREIREQARLSQTIFANYLNVSKNLVSDWERGDKIPDGAALLLLALAKSKGVEAISL